MIFRGLSPNATIIENMTKRSKELSPSPPAVRWICTASQRLPFYLHENGKKNILYFKTRFYFQSFFLLFSHIVHHNCSFFSLLSCLSLSYLPSPPDPLFQFPSERRKHPVRPCVYQGHHIWPRGKKSDQEGPQHNWGCNNFTESNHTSYTFIRKKV